MSSSYNTPRSKRKLVVNIYSNTETSLAMSTLVIRCRVVRSRDFSVPPPFSLNARKSPQQISLARLRYRVLERSHARDSRPGRPYSHPQ